jgi:hypothetical protein
MNGIWKQYVPAPPAIKPEPVIANGVKQSAFHNQAKKNGREYWMLDILLP